MHRRTIEFKLFYVLSNIEVRSNKKYQRFSGYRVPNSTFLSLN